MKRTWVQTIFQPLVVATMMACLAMSVVQLLQLLVPTWSGVYLTLIVFLAALEAMAAGRLVRRYRLRGGDWLSFRAGEWVLILLALKLGSYAAWGIDVLLADIALWREDLGFLFTPEYIIAICLTLLTWAMATDIESDLTNLAAPYVGVPINREDIHSRLMGRFFWGGMILMIMAGITRLGMAGILNLAHPPAPGIILNVLLYFVLGLLLVSQARLTALQARWQSQDIHTAADLGSRWSRASLAFIVLVGAVALLLPTSYSFGLLESIGLILGLVLKVLYYIAVLVVFVLSLPFLFLLSLLGLGTAWRPLPSALLTPSPMTPSPEAAGPSLWAAFRSLIFWGLLVGIAIYALRSYVAYRADLLSSTGIYPVLRRLWTFLIDLWRQLRGVAADAIRPIRRRLAWDVPGRAPGDQRRLPWRWRRLSSMSPRERIQYYYLSIVHRAEKVNRARRASETPYEYSASLRRRKPDVEPDLTELTEAFVEARYSCHAITHERAGRVQQSWNRIKQALRT